LPEVKDVKPPRLALPGRGRELRALEELLERVGERGGALVVRGEAGVGKSALLEAARRMASSRGMAVLATTGVESEAHLPFAGLHQLLRPALARLDRLPEPQRAAVQAAFGMTDAAAPDFFLIALAALDLLSDMAASRPLLLVVEDAHWLDAATCDVLGFVARRLEFEPVVLLFALRTGVDARIDPAGLPVLALDGLDEPVAAALLDEHAPDLSPELRQRVLAEAAGNPLALQELPRAVAGDPALSPATPLPLTERLEQAFAAQTSDLPATTRLLMLVAALDDGGGIREVLAAASFLAGRSVTAVELGDAGTAQLVTVEADGVRFRHPLVRSAIYQESPALERQAAHAALAAIYADEDADRSVWHRAASLAAPDDAVSRDLEEAAARAVRRGAPTVAASGLARAAQLTTDARRRGTLLVRAGEIEFGLGHIDRSIRFLREAQQLELGRHDRTRLAFLLETLDQAGWSGAAHAPSFVDIADELSAAGDAAGALNALLTVALRCWWGNPDQETRDLVVAAAERLPVPEDDPALIATIALTDPVSRGAVAIDRIAAGSPATATEPDVAFLLGSSAAAVWAQDLSVGFLATAVDGFRVQGRLGGLVQALVSQAWSGVMLANHSVAAPAAEEAERLGAETGQPLWSTAATLARAMIAADRGETAVAAELAATAERVLLPIGANPMLSLVQFARGRAALVDGRFTDAYEHLRRIFDAEDIAYHPFVRGWAFADLVDAATHDVVRLAETRAFLADLEAMTAATNAPLLRAQVSYARALLAPEDEAEPLFRAALANDLGNWPGLRARMVLAYGTWLRRRRRVAESRSPLRGAAEAFGALGFVVLAERAQQELRAAGETPRRRKLDPRDELTPQELQIARMAADGLTNREIGQKLYLSHRTVGSHLYRIFPKLGVTARSQLRDAIDEVAPL
jgi:DNA-binding CsgD family transcriptional regulator